MEREKRGQPISNYIAPGLMLLYSLVCIIIPIKADTPNIGVIYATLVASSFIYTIILFTICNHRKLDLFEPLVLVFLLHIMIFLVAPIRSIWIDDVYHKTGPYTFGGAIKGTVIAIISFILFAFAYEYKYSRVISHVNDRFDDRTSEEEINKSLAILISLVVWGIGFIAAFAFLALRGMSLSYILSLGRNGDFNDELSMNSAFSFLSVISNLTFGSWLIYYRYGRNRLLVWILFFFTTATLIVRGYRIFILVLIASPVLLRYLLRRERPKMRTILFMLIVVSVMIGVVGWSRHALRTGGTLNLSDFSFDEISNAIWGNVDIYKTYYGVVENIPKNMGFTLGSQIFGYTILLFVPRTIWPMKPQPVIKEVVAKCIGGYAALAGSAYPALGEWYHEFGMVGCFIFSIIAGNLVCKLIKLLYSEDEMDMIMYSLAFPSLIQLFIRGYTPSNFWFMVTTFVPIIVIRNLVRKRS